MIKGGALHRSAQAASSGEAETPAASRPTAHTPSSVTLAQAGMDDRSLPPTPDVRLYHRAVVVAQETTGVSRGQRAMDTAVAMQLYCCATLLHDETLGGIITASSNVALVSCVSVDGDVSGAAMQARCGVWSGSSLSISLRTRVGASAAIPRSCSRRQAVLRGASSRAARRCLSVR